MTSPQRSRRPRSLPRIHDRHRAHLLRTHRRHYEDAIAADPRIDALRAKMTAREDPLHSRDYLDRDKRSIANAMQVFFRDGTSTPRLEVEYAIGHRRRLAEGIPLLIEKFGRNAATKFAPTEVADLRSLLLDRPRLEAARVADFMGQLARH